MSDDSDFEFNDSAGEVGRPVQASSVSKGKYIISADRPCLVLEVSKSKPGKHGSAKLNMQIKDIFTGKKTDIFCPAHDTLYVPNVLKNEYVLCDYDDEFCNVMKLKGSLKEIRLNPEIKEKIDALDPENNEVLIQVMSWNGEEAITSVRASTK